LVSVIIIFLNAEQFIQEAITSVLAQTYDQWELLLVDDGSGDRSSDIALRFVQQYPEKIYYLNHPDHQNRGMSASRNLGIRNAIGEYIAFLDADDVWFPHKLQQQVAVLESWPEAGMIYGRSLYWYSWTGEVEDLQRDFMQSLGVPADTLAEPPGLVKLFLRKEAPAPCPSDVLVRRKIVEEIRGFEEQFRDIYQLFEDQAFFAKVCLRTPVFIAHECWDSYRQHADSCVTVVKRAGQYHTVRQFFLGWLELYLSEQGFSDTEVWQVLQTELWPYRHPTLWRLRGYVRYGVRQMQLVLTLIIQRTSLSSVRGKRV